MSGTNAKVPRWLCLMRRGAEQFKLYLDSRRKKTIISDHGVEVQRWLRVLRGGTEQYDSYIACIREEARDNNLSLEDIGTSEAELEELRFLGCKTAAREWLRFLRNGTRQYESFLAYFRQEVADGNFSLADFGTSEKELEKLRLLGCRIAALYSLRYLRNGTGHPEWYIDSVRTEARKGDFLLAEIGTSEEELASFTPVQVFRGPDGIFEHSVPIM